MPLIHKEIKAERTHVRMRLDIGVLADLESYCRFIDSSRDFVVENILGYVFKKDREFQEWLAANKKELATKLAGHQSPPIVSPEAIPDASRLPRQKGATSEAA